MSTDSRTTAQSVAQETAPSASVTPCVETQTQTVSAETPTPSNSSLSIPSAAEFTQRVEAALAEHKALAKAETDKKAIQEADEAKVKATAAAEAKQKFDALSLPERVAEHVRRVEAAFKAPDWLTKGEARVLIDGEKCLFEKSVEQALLDQKYNVEYVLEKAEPGRTVAYIFPGNYGGYLTDALTALMDDLDSMGGFGSLFPPYLIAPSLKAPCKSCGKAACKSGGKVH